MWNYAWKTSEVGTDGFRLYRVTGSGFANAEGRTDLDRAAPRDIAEKNFGQMDDEGHLQRSNKPKTSIGSKSKVDVTGKTPHTRKASAQGFHQK